MGFYGRSRYERSRRDAHERENAWSNCPRHGGYNPWQRTLGGWRRGECPKCQAARYEEQVRLWAEQRAAATTDRPDPSASAEAADSLHPEEPSSP